MLIVCDNAVNPSSSFYRRQNDASEGAFCLYDHILFTNMVRTRKLWLEITLICLYFNILIWYVPVCLSI